MKFFSAGTTPRPVRLSKEIRNWAWESLHGKYGDEAMKYYAVPIDDIEGFDDMTSIQQYDAAIRQIALKAPIRVCKEELISGSGTLGIGISHKITVTRGGEEVIEGISHLTINYKTTIDEGIDSYSEKIAKRLEDPTLTEEQVDFLHSLQNTIESMQIWHKRYLDATKDVKPEIYKNLLQVPFKPARNFYEAVQSLWFEFAFVRVCGCWPGIGRIDQLLGKYLKKDLADGTITKEKAREILASFFIKGCEWIESNTPKSTGDAQHYQNIILAGVDEDGNEVTNEVTYLVLDIVEELAISDFPISVRLNSHTPEKLLRKVAQVMRHGGGIIALYNEEVVIKALEKEGYSTGEARSFANDGCWEVQIPGKTCFEYSPFDALQIFDTALGVDDCSKPIPQFNSLDELYQAFLNGVSEKIEALYDWTITRLYHNDGGKWQWIKPLKKPLRESSVISLFEDGCIENAASYFNFGPKYFVRSPHAGGLTDIANSMYAISKLVYEEKRVTMSELIEILRNNWEGHEELRQYVRNKYSYYGNDSEESDAWTAKIRNDFAKLVHDCEKAHSDCPAMFIPGVSTFGRNVDWLGRRRAVAFGYKQGEILAGNDSPTPGTDTSGATAIIKSYCKADLTEMTCGAALDLKIFPDTLKGEDGIQALKSLMKGFVKLGGCFVQPDVVDAATLHAAQADPLAYKTLSVRVSGWNARFVTLKDTWQQMIIERTEQGF